jgi:hypothetical protein
MTSRQRTEILNRHRREKINYYTFLLLYVYKGSKYGISLLKYISNPVEKKGPGSDWLRAGRSGDQIPVWGETFRTCQDRC